MMKEQSRRSPRQRIHSFLLGIVLGLGGMLVLELGARLFADAVEQPAPSKILSHVVVPNNPTLESSTTPSISVPYRP